MCTLWRGGTALLQMSKVRVICNCGRNSRWYKGMMCCNECWFKDLWLIQKIGSKQRRLRFVSWSGRGWRSWYLGLIASVNYSVFNPCRGRMRVSASLKLHTSGGWFLAQAYLSRSSSSMTWESNCVSPACASSSALCRDLDIVAVLDRRGVVCRSRKDKGWVAKFKTRSDVEVTGSRDLRKIKN